MAKRKAVFSNRVSKIEESLFNLDFDQTLIVKDLTMDQVNWLKGNYMNDFNVLGPKEDSENSLNDDKKYELFFQINQRYLLTEFRAYMEGFSRELSSTDPFAPLYRTIGGFGNA